MDARTLDLYGFYRTILILMCASASRGRGGGCFQIETEYVYNLVYRIIDPLNQLIFQFNNSLTLTRAGMSASL